jgi:hypothetical protein
MFRAPLHWYQELRFFLIVLLCSNFVYFPPAFYLSVFLVTLLDSCLYAFPFPPPACFKVHWCPEEFFCTSRSFARGAVAVTLRFSEPDGEVVATTLPLGKECRTGT